MTKATYCNDLELDVGGQSYRVKVKAVGLYDYRPAVMYLRNGDPGYPEEENWEIDDVDAIWRKINEDGDETEVEPTADMEEALYEYLYDLDYDQWNFPEEPEPDYEPWED